LIPYPAATDNHQFHNARAFEATGAARLLEQNSANPELLDQLLSDVVGRPAVREQMQNALAQWHAPRAAEELAEAMLRAVGAVAHKDRQTNPETAISTGSQAEERRGKQEDSEHPQLARSQQRQKGPYKTPLPAGRIA
jgi:hypothetical protein